MTNSMTNSMTSHSVPPHPPVVLDPDEAVDLARLLDLIEDWLSHADDDARDDLAGYLDGTGHGVLAAAGLIRAIELAAVGLHRRLKEANR